MNLRAPKLQAAMESRLGPGAVDSSLSSLMASIAKGQERIDKLLNAGLGGLADAPPSNQELLSRQAHSYREAARLEARAEELYRLAWVSRDRDPAEAIRKFEIVLAVTEPGSFVHENARNQLLTLALRR